MKVSPDSAAALIARLLKQRGIRRVFALCGGHIMPIWMRLDAEGIRIIDVRDERAAVYMGPSCRSGSYGPLCAPMEPPVRPDRPKEQSPMSDPQGFSWALIAASVSKAREDRR